MLAACGGGGDEDDGSGSGTETNPSPTSSGADSAASDGVDGTAGDDAGPPGPTDGAWAPRARIGLGPRQECGVAALDGEVYVLGGFSEGGGLVPRVEAYDPATDTWRQTADFPISTVHHPNLAGAAGKLWVAGYLSGLTFDAVGQTWSYDPATDVWSEHAEMPAGTERGASATAVLDGQLYVVGGLRDGVAVADAWTYDPAADAWAPIAPLPSARDHLVAGAVGGKLYAAGGRAAEVSAHVDTLDVFDPATGSWSAGPPMPTSRGGAMAAVVGDWLFVGGGEGNPESPDGVFAAWEVFDTTTQSWSSLPDMPTPRHGTGAAAIGDAVFVPGGGAVMAIGAVDTHEVWTVGG